MTPFTRFILLVAGTLVGISFHVLVAPGASGQHCYEEERTRWSHGNLITIVVLVCPPHDPSDATDTVGDTPPPPLGSATCIAAAILLGVPPEELCGRPDSLAPPTITGGLVARALRRMALPASDLVIQPPGGRTLVNFETNFLTTNDQPLLRSIQLLGRRIELRIWPESYTWHFGDGEVATTTTPGARFPNLDITHNYLQTGAYQPSVDTTYAAEWRVGDSAWQPVSGTATIAGDPASLQAIEARPTLVGYGG